MLEIELSRHALLRLHRRGLDLSWVEEVVRHPEWSQPDRNDPQLERRFGRIEAMGGRALRVVVLPITAQKCRVVTAFLDRDARESTAP